MKLKMFAMSWAITGLQGVALVGDVLRVTVRRPDGDVVFEGRVSRPGADTIPGCFGPFAWGLVPARLSFTEKDKPASAELV